MIDPSAFSSWVQNDHSSTIETNSQNTPSTPMSSAQTNPPWPGSYGDILSGALGQPHSHETLNLLRHLYHAHPTFHHVSVLGCSDSTFPLSRYLESQGIAVSID